MLILLDARTWDSETSGDLAVDEISDDTLDRLLADEEVPAQ